MIKTVFIRALLFILLWWGLSGGETDSLWLAIATVIAAVVLSIRMLPDQAFSWYGFFLFMPYFIRHSILGGIDVAKRAFNTRLPLDPDVVDYKVALRSDLAQTIFINIIGLLPGSLVTGIKDDVIRIHVIDHRVFKVDEIKKIESYVLKMFP